MVGLLFKLFIRLSCHSPIKLSILGEAVENRIRYNKQAHCFELLAKVENVIYQNAALGVHVYKHSKNKIISIIRETMTL